MIRQMIEPRQQPLTRKHLPLYAFFAGSVISYVGDMLTLLALPWFVLQTTRSVTQTGITAFFSALPMVLSSFLSTTLVDRLGYKRTSVIGDILSCVTIALVPLLYHTVGLAFWQLFGLVFIGGLLKSPGVTARSAMAPELAQIAGERLEKVNALSDGIYRLSRFVGAPLAGVLIVIIGTSNLLWFDGLSFAISALLIGLLVPAVPAVVVPVEENAAGYFAAVWAGLHYIWRNSLVFSILMACLFANLLDAAWSGVVAPVYFQRVFHSPVFQGISIAAFGGAAFASTLIFSMIGHRLPRRFAFGIGFLVGGSLRFWVFLLRSFPLIIACHIVAGFAIAPVNPLIDTVLQERVHPEMRARVFGTVSAVVMAAVPLGTFASGFVTTWLGLSLTIAIMGALYTLSTLSLLLNPVLKKM